MTSGTGGGKSVMLKLVVDYRILACGLGFSLMILALFLKPEGLFGKSIEERA